MIRCSPCAPWARRLRAFMSPTRWANRPPIEDGMLGVPTDPGFGLIRWLFSAKCRGMFIVGRLLQKPWPRGDVEGAAAQSLPTSQSCSTPRGCLVRAWT